MAQQEAAAKAGGQAQGNGREHIELTLATGKKVRVASGTSLRDVLPMNERAYDSPIVAATWNNKVTSLDRRVDRDGEVDFVDLSSRDGGLIFRRSLTFVLIRAVSELFPGLKLYINHSLNRGYYGEVYDERIQSGSPVLLAETDIARIEKRMIEIIEADDRFERLETTRDEAIKLFRERGMLDKVSVLEFRENDKVSLYRFGELVNHFYGQLAPSSGMLKPFGLKLCPPGFVLLFPQHGKPGNIPTYQHDEKLFSVFQEYEKWSRILGVRSVAQLNRLVEDRQIKEYVLVAEALHERKLAGIADRIMNLPNKPRIVLIAGPSASGKTTSVKRLSIQLRVLGYRPLVISLDNFFVPREQTPRDEHGDYDFEAFEAIDSARLSECVRKLLRGEVAEIPHFDFQAGRAVSGTPVKLEPGQPLILEGIHGLNRRLLPDIPDGLKFKLYVSPLTHLNIDDHNRIATSDIRLIRRMVRDSKYRGYTAAETIRRWPSVRRGEERNIFPYQGEADAIFNSALHYELSIMRAHALPLLREIKRQEPEFREASRLLKFLSYFREIKADDVPRHSLLREFIGGSSFKY